MSRLRAFNFDAAPELAAYMPRTTVQDRVHTGGLAGARRAGYRTVAGMVAVITSVLAGATAALVTVLVSSHSLAASLVVGGIVALASVAALMEYQLSAWLRYEVDSEDASDVASE
jgi:predicted phage tail protein